MLRAIGFPRRGAHYATTAHLRAALPFQASSGLGGRGVYLGRDATGAAFCFDPFDLYERGLLTGPAMVVLGEIGRGKSAFVKSYLHRQCGVFGRGAIVVSPKRGEYDRLAAAFGVEPIRLRPGGGVILNPLASRTGEEQVEQRALRGVAAACLGRPLTPAEDAALAQALRAVKVTGSVPTLPRVVRVLLAPPDDAWRERWRSAEHWLEESREAALALDRLCEGDAAGMFDGETSAAISLDAPLVVLDLSSVAESSAIAILMTAAMGWVQAQVAAETDHDHRKRILVVDEAWRVLSNLSAAEALVDAVKHSRAYGIQTITVTHRIGDLAAAGDEGTRVSRIAEGLLSDAETKVVFAQAPDQVKLARERLGLTSTEAEVLPQLGRGEALWKVGTRSFLVLHRLSEREALICDTDARMVRRSRRSRLVKTWVAVIALALAGCGGVQGAVESPVGSSVGAALPFTGASQNANPTPGLDVTPTAGAADQRRADRVARRFVRAYLAFTYRSDAGPLRRAPATPELVASLVASPPDIPADVRRRSPRMVAVKLSWQGSARASALVTVDDGASRYPVAVQLERAGSAFRVVGMEP